MPTPIHLSINNFSYDLPVDPERSLLSVLRDEVGLTGAKYGCGEGKCGACTVLLDGNPVQSCSLSIGAAVGKTITTIEGIAANGRLHPLQAAFLEQESLQCGYCTPGMILSSLALLQRNPQPNEAEIKDFLHDHLCRCGAYPRIVAAVQAAASRLADASDLPDTSDQTPVQPVPPLDAPDIPDPLAEGIIVAYPCPDLVAVRFPEGTELPAPADRPLAEIGPWLHIDGEGRITLAIGKAEVGQNTRTAMAQIVAEELRVPVERVRVIMGDTAHTPFDMGTFGSRSTPITGSQVWKVGAASRETLLALAAAAWQVEPSELHVENATVSHPPTGRTASFGDLARDRNLLRIADDQALVTPPEAWTTAGQSIAKVGGRPFVTGQHHFASDMRLPGMGYGKILRPPAYQATLDWVDTSAAEQMDGVQVVREGDFVGVVASDEGRASQALNVIRTRWKTQLQVSQPELFDYLKANPIEGEGRYRPYLSIIGSVEQGLAEAHLTLKRSYTVDYIAHVPLEPRAALAVWEGDKLTVWTGTSRPFGVRTELSLAFSIPETKIRVIVPDTGSGYGGKHTGQAAIEAARLAKATGKPVKLLWTRQEEFTWAYLRPAGLIEVTAGVDATGHFTALELHNYNSGAAGIESLYEIPNRYIHYQPTDSPLPQGSYRSLAAPANHFARESLVDELAHSLGLDPLEMRLRNLKDERMIAVLTHAAEAFGWGKTTPAEHHGVGIAGGFDKNSYVATCAEVSVDPTTLEVQVRRVVVAYDCGALINPANVRNQVEGAVIQGLGGALYESIQFANGRLLNPTFADYRMPRFADIPVIETILIDRKDVPSAGAGETPIVAIAPAIGNAIFQATGMRVRSMPMRLSGKK